MGYANYGGRGITVCERWEKFENFLADMGEPPPGMELDRIDVDGNYEPSNCRWATEAEQVRNRRRAKRSTNMLTFRGETLCISDWAKRTGIKRRCIHDRLSKMNWSVEDALTRPVEIHV